MIVLPFLGPLTYLVINHHALAVRAFGDTEGSREELDYVRATTNGEPSAGIERAKELLDSGAITQMESAAIKAKLIA